MKIIQHSLLALMVCLAILSCRSNVGKESATAEGFSKIENQIKSEFGAEAYFTDLSIVFNKSIGNITGVTVTKDPALLKMGEWNLTQGSWKQNSEISLEVPDGSEAVDFMYQLNEQINLTTLGGLIEKSKDQLKEVQKVEKPILSIASILFPENGDASKTEYLVNLQPESGGTTYRFYYNLKGELRKMDY